MIAPTGVRLVGERFDAAMLEAAANSGDLPHRKAETTRDFDSRDVVRGEQHDASATHVTARSAFARHDAPQRVARVVAEFESRLLHAIHYAALSCA